MDTLISFLRFAHILGVVFMAWPLYALITVNERGRLGPPLGDRADHYMENIIRGMAVRCYAFQIAVLASGLLLVWLRGLGLGALLTDWVLGVKFLLLLALMGLLSYVHFNLQPRLDGLFSQASGQAMPKDLAAAITTLRLRRKKFAATCLFLVLAAVLLGLQVYARFPLLLTGVLLLGSALFAWRAFRTRIPYGWV